MIDNEWIAGVGGPKFLPRGATDVVGSCKFPLRGTSDVFGCRKFPPRGATDVVGCCKLPLRGAADHPDFFKWPRGVGIRAGKSMACPGGYIVL